MDWIHSHLAADEPIVAASCLHDALTSATAVLYFEVDGVEVVQLVDKVLTALPERDILRKTELVRAMEVWKRRRRPATPLRVVDRPAPEPTTGVSSRSLDECELDEPTKIFRSPFLAAS